MSRGDEMGCRSDEDLRPTTSDCGKVPAEAPCVTSHVRVPVDASACGASPADAEPTGAVSADVHPADFTAAGAAPADALPTGVTSKGPSSVHPSPVHSAGADGVAAGASSSNPNAEPSEPWSEVIRNDRWVTPYFRRYRRVLALALGLGIVAAILACLLMFVSGWLIGAAARMPETIFALLIPIGIVQVIGISKPIVGYFERLASHDWVLRMTSSLRRRLFLAFERLLAVGDASRLDAEAYGAGVGGESAVLGAGDALALLNEDIGRVQNLYLRCVFPMVTAWAVVAVAVIAVGAMDILFACWLLLELFICVAVVPLVALAVGAGARLRRKRATAGLYRSLTDAVLGAADVAFADRTADVLARFSREAAAVSAEDRRLARLDRAQGLLVRAVLAVAAVSLVFFAARVLSFQSDAILAAVICFFPLVEAVSPVSDAMAQLPEHAEEIRRLADLDDGEGRAGTSDQIGPNAPGAAGVHSASDAPAVTDAAGVSAVTNVPATAGTAGDAGFQTAANMQNPASAPEVSTSKAVVGGQVSAGASAAAGNEIVPNTEDDRTPLSPDRGVDSDLAGTVPAVRLRGVTFTHVGALRPAVAGLSFDLMPGEKVALLGRSGAGKSTLLSLIRGDLIPGTGEVELFGDPHPGADAACVLIGVINQDPHVFNTTVLDNLRIARADVSEDEAWRVLDRVGLRERIERFPEGVMSVVGEEGHLLSGGERHRLALARILLADTPIVVLDEPFVGLDPATEGSVLDAVLDALADRSLLMVTHHLQGVERMDRVAFLEDGQFALMGMPDDLARTSARYRRLLAADRGLAG